MNIENKLKLIRKIYIDKEFYNYFFNPFYPRKNINISEIKTKWIQLYKENPDHLTHLYVHTPYCIDNCKFCHCKTGMSIEGKTLDNYLDFLDNYTEEFINIFNQVNFSGLFFGGGTASIYSEKQLERLMKIIFNKFKFNTNYFKEYELHPMTTSFKKLDILKKYGFNRLNFGIQSFNKESLKKEGRIYCSPKRLKYLISYARELGFEVINSDLIIGLNDEKKEDVSYSFQKMIECKPTTITLYTLQGNKKTSILYEGEEKFYANIKEIHDYLVDNFIKDSDYEITSYHLDSVMILTLKGFSNSKKNYKEHNTIVESIYGIGFGSFSNIYGIGKYFIQYNNYDIESLNISFEKLTKDDEKNIMLARFIQIGTIHIDFFKENFDFDFKENYKNELAYLEENNKIEIKGDKIIFMTPNIEETYIYGLLFFNLKFILQHSLYIKLVGERGYF